MSKPVAQQSRNKPWRNLFRFFILAKWRNLFAVRQKISINQLPDDVLRHVLSFLPTKQAIATSVLSKQWRYLWIWVPVLDLDSTNSNSVATFSEFVNRALSLNKVAPLDKFSLHCSSPLGGYQSLNDWIDSALRRGFQELDISIVGRPPEYFKLPGHFFTIKNLQVLKLSDGILVDVPDGLSVSFPSLKILHLNHSKYANDKSFLRLLGGCIALEELAVKRSNLDDNVRNLIIHVPTLKTLKLTIYDGISWSICGERVKNWNKNELTIDASNLQYLKINDFSGLVYSEDVCGSLVEANITSNVAGLFQLTTAIKHTKFLSLETGLLRFGFGRSHMAARMNVDRFPLFINLIKLDLTFSETFYWDVASLFLQNSPKLEVFVIKLENIGWHRVPQVEVPRIISKPFEGLPKCLSPHLRELYCAGFRGSQPEIDMVECIMKNASALQLIEICSWRFMSSESKSSVRHKLLKSPRLSPKCQLIFH